jgi:mono/diheme cytochrome c family protein
MRISKLMMLVGALAVTLFVLLPNLSWAAEDGAAMYKAKCAVCHGAEGQGKPAAKIPSLVSDDAKKMSNDQLTDAIANGGKDKKASHTFAQKGVTPDQIKALVEQIRSMQK